MSELNNLDSLDNKDKSAIKYDDDKLKWHLIPWDIMIDVASVFTYGSKKYSDRNWENGINVSRLFSAVMRHLISWWDGEEIDEETSLSHLVHAIVDIMMMEWMVRYRPDYDDRPGVVSGEI